MTSRRFWPWSSWRSPNLVSLPWMPRFQLLHRLLLHKMDNLFWSCLTKILRDVPWTFHRKIRGPCRLHQVYINHSVVLLAETCPMKYFMNDHSHNFIQMIIHELSFRFVQYYYELNDVTMYLIVFETKSELYSYSEFTNFNIFQIIQGSLPFYHSGHGVFWGLGCTDPSFDPHARGGCLGFPALPTSNGGHTGSLERGAWMRWFDMGNGQENAFWSHSIRSLLENTVLLSKTER